MSDSTDFHSDFILVQRQFFELVCELMFCQPFFVLVCFLRSLFDLRVGGFCARACWLRHFARSPVCLHVLWQTGFLGLPRGLFAPPRAWWWWGWLVVACGCSVLCRVCPRLPGLLCLSLRFLLLGLGCCCCWCLVFLGLALPRSPLLAAVLRSLRSLRALAFLFLSLCLV